MFGVALLVPLNGLRYYWRNSVSTPCFQRSPSSGYDYSTGGIRLSIHQKWIWMSLCGIKRFGRFASQSLPVQTFSTPGTRACYVSDICKCWNWLVFIKLLSRHIKCSGNSKSHSLCMILYNPGKCISAPSLPPENFHKILLQSWVKAHTRTNRTWVLWHKCSQTLWDLECFTCIYIYWSPLIVPLERIRALGFWRGLDTFPNGFFHQYAL